jgi:hypothetical protein
MVSLIYQSSTFVIEKISRFEAIGVTSDESGSAEEVDVLGHAI